MALWRGDGSWIDGGGFSARISSAKTSRDAIVVIDNDNLDWGGRGRIRESDSDVIDVSFNNGRCLSARLVGSSLQFENGTQWERRKFSARRCWAKPQTASAASPSASVAKEQEADSQEWQLLAGTKDEAGEDMGSGEVVGQGLEGTELHLQREARLLSIVLERFLSLALVLVSLCLQWALLPSLYVTTVACSSGFVVASSFLLCAGVLDIDSVLILLLNAVVLMPYNLVVIILYYLTWPIRMVLYQAFQQWLIYGMSSKKVHPSFLEASYVEFLRVCPEAFNEIILPADPQIKPFDNIDEATQAQARTAIRNAAFMKKVRAFSAEHLPRGLLNSLGFALVSEMVTIVTIGWWLLGLCWIPLLSMNAQSSASVTRSAPAVSLRIPKCRMLSTARRTWGEQLGRQKCLNE